jgi:hypothetical protein
MKIYEYYRDTAKLSLNGSIAALLPAIFIIGGNLSFFKDKEIMLLTIPFLVYSLICFQIYLFNMKKSIFIGKRMVSVKSSYHSIFEVSHLLLVFQKTRLPVLRLYFSNGYLAGELRKVPSKKLILFSKCYALFDAQQQIMGYFRVKRNRTLSIEVYNRKKEYLGCYEKTKLGMWKSKKELLNSSGHMIGKVQGSRIFMDEQIKNQNLQGITRLRRGWMPLEWERYFPQPNTPVLSFENGLTEEDKLLGMSILINEFFIER